MINQRISSLRTEMKARDIDVYIVPSSDPHQSEYVPERYKARAWLTGFTGSAGTAVITKDKALLWADGRYHIQAQKQIEGSEFELIKWGLEGVPEVHEWIAQNHFEGMTVGFDGAVISLSTKRTIESALNPKTVSFKTEEDLIDLIWSERPAVPMEKIMVHEMPYAANTVSDKFERVRTQMKSQGADYIVLSTLDDIAWLYNYRGWDVAGSPVSMAYAVISEKEAHLFIESGKVGEKARAHFNLEKIHVHEYADVFEWLAKLPKGVTVTYDPETISVNLGQSLPEHIVLSEHSNVVAYTKAMKTQEEISNLRTCQVKDGVAMVRFHIWLENIVAQGGTTELEVEEKLKEYRSEQADFVSESFTTIAGYKDHGAMMHYRATEESNYVVKQDGFLLFDSGGNYLDGTTDITRTVALGNLTEQMKKDYTLTLISHIRLAKLRFLHGATGSKIEMVAREPFWAVGMDYKCGTGHGVGYFMNVHEGPQTMRMAPNTVKLQPGMILTDEPGVYRNGEYGIRLENVLVVQEDIATEFGQFLSFETISYCPLDKTPVIKSMMNKEEIEWLDGYHKNVYETLRPHLTEDERNWLKEATKPL